ncbi:MAG TPA: DUF4836 family protein [Chitinophagaceae bacterium]|nr:DUF4836 family protein [Chitinophagaceae bacterium]
MKSFFRLSIFIVIAAFLFSSCKHAGEAGKMIPKDAMFVLHIDTKSLSSKLPFSEIKNAAWYGELKKHIAEMHHLSDSAANDLFDHPENSGVDLDKGLFYFIAKNSSSDAQLVSEGSIKDADAFGKFYKKLDTSATIQKDGELNVLTIKDKLVMVWNSSNFVSAFNLPRDKMSGHYFGDTHDTANTPAPLIDPSVALTSYCKSLFSLKSDSSLSENSKFSDLIKEPGDIHAWINSESIMKSSGRLGMLGMLKMDDLIKDNVSTYTVNFDNGKIDITHKGYTSKELGDLLRKYSGSGISADMIKTIPSQDVTGLLALNFKPEGLKALVTLIGVDGLINSGLSETGITLDDFVKAMKGDVMLSFTDFSVKKATDTLMPVSKPDVNVLFSVSVGDKQSFQKVMDAAKKMGGAMHSMDTSIAYGQNDKVFAITNHQHFLNDYLAGKADNKFDFMDKIKGHSVGLFIDLHKILTAASASEKYHSGDDSTIMAASLGMWNNVISAGGDFNGDAMMGHTEINLVDQNTNSLKQLNNYFNAIVPVLAEKEEQWEKERKAASSADSTMIPPPPPVDSTTK